ncbi:MAG: IclR family transcriptional regulator [Propionibacterium sp.]|nr:IclR family transcriptional regulator [Propionibacterium sp.]
MSSTQSTSSDDGSAWVRTTPMASETAADAEALKSVATALDLLECFAVDTELGVSDIARRLGIAKSTAHRLLTTLASRRIIDQNHETGKYRLGLHLLELGILVQGRHEIRHAALPVMIDISRRTGYTVNLSVPDGPDVVFIERIEIGVARQLLSHYGRRYPAHVTSSGKAIAAHNASFDCERRTAGFPPRASRTIRSEADWGRALDEVRRRGFAASNSESFDRFSTVAVPLLALDGTAFGALSMLGPTSQFDGAFERHARMLHVAAKRVVSLIR